MIELVSSEIRQGSNPDFCPPVEEGITLSFQDEKGDEVWLEFLGILLHNGRKYGFFFQVDDDNPALSSGEVVVLEVVEEDSDGIPSGFELVDDEDIACEVYEHFAQATKDIYKFE